MVLRRDDFAGLAHQLVGQGREHRGDRRPISTSDCSPSCSSTTTTTSGRGCAGAAGGARARTGRRIRPGTSGPCAELSCFDVVAVTAEDSDRTAMYAAERDARRLRTDVGSLDDWIRELQIVVTAEPLGSANLPRAAQLLNKTNQMNLRDAKVGGSGDARVGGGRRACDVVRRVADRLGEAGLTGLVSVDVDGTMPSSSTSCSAAASWDGRVEETMVHLAGEMAIRGGASRLGRRVSPDGRRTAVPAVLRPCARSATLASTSTSPRVRHATGSTSRPCRRAGDGVVIRLRRAAAVLEALATTVGTGVVVVGTARGREHGELHVGEGRRSSRPGSRTWRSGQVRRCASVVHASGRRAALAAALGQSRSATGSSSARS